jgi:hypothetical protein
MDQTLDDLEFSGMKEGSFGIMPLAKAVLATYFPQQAEELERTGELTAVKGGVVLPGVKYVWVGKKGQKTRKMESRGRIAIKTVAPEALQMLQDLDEPDAMDPLEKLIFLEDNVERYANEHGISLEEATAELRPMLGLDVPEMECDWDEGCGEEFLCLECGDPIEVVEDESIPELCSHCHSMELYEWLKKMVEEENRFFRLYDDFEGFDRFCAFDGSVPDLPANVLDKPEKPAKEYPARQSRWHNNLGVSAEVAKKFEGPIDKAAPKVWFHLQSGKRPILHKERRYRSGERYFGARISEVLFLKHLAVYDHERREFIKPKPAACNVVDTHNLLRLKFERTRADRVEVFGAPEKVATNHDREFFERLFLPLEGRA